MRRRFAGLLVAGVAVAAVLAWQFGGVEQGRAGRPVIGVSYDDTLLNHLGLTRAAYDLALARVDADIVTLRPGAAAPAQLVEGLDGLLLSGGGDVDPDLFGLPGQPAEMVDRDRDDFELALLEAALLRGIPVLGICRGLQLINVALGGTLLDLRTVDPERHATHGIGTSSLSAHPVRIEPRSRLARAVGLEQPQPQPQQPQPQPQQQEQRVTSFHGQTIGELAPPLWAVAVAPDGVIEGIELPEQSGGPWLIAVQWHPELESVTDDDQLALFKTLAAQARLGPRAGTAPAVRKGTAPPTAAAP